MHKPTKKISPKLPEKKVYSCNILPRETKRRRVTDHFDRDSKPEKAQYNARRRHCLIWRRSRVRSGATWLPLLGFIIFALVAIALFSLREFLLP